MKSKIIFAIFALLAIVPSCKKGSTFSGAKVYVQTDFRAGVISTYTYNSDGTVTTVQNNSGNIRKITFQYSSGSVTTSSTNAANNTVDATTYTLNSSGYAQSSQGQFVSQNSSATYAYDGSGHLIEQKNYGVGNALVSDAVYSFPSTVATVLDFANAGGVHTYHYYTYVTNIVYSMGVQNKGENYLGVSSNNPISVDYTVNQAGDTTDILTYRYHYDGSSRVDTFASHNKNGQLIDSMAFSYY